MHEPYSTTSSLTNQHPAGGLFSPLSELDQFRQIIEKFCADQNYHDLKLTEAQLTQLKWYQGNSVITPQAPIEEIKAKINFDIKRSLSRLYSFELLLRGDEQAYQEFIQVQSNNPLPRNIFNSKAKEAQQLPDDVKQVIKATCLLTISDEAKKRFEQQCGVKIEEYNNDSELFLTSIADHLINQPNLFPITSHLTIDQRKLLQKAYWPNTHLRHLIFTEGANNMISSLVGGITQGKFNLADFQLWKWRWLTNLMGFDGGPGAKYFNEENDSLAHSVISGLESLFAAPSTPFLSNYLAWRINQAKFNYQEYNLTPAEQNLLAHLAAYFLNINILNADLGKSVLNGYLQFKESCPEDPLKLANLYEIYRHHPHAVTPTYMPAVMSNSFGLFKKELNDALPKNANPIELATLFTCQVLTSVYVQPANQLISGRDLAFVPNLKNTLTEWLKNNMQIRFTINNKGELMIAGYGPVVQPR